MNRMLVQGHPPLQDIQNAYSSLPDILNLLRLSQSDTSFASDFDQAFELCDFQLGDRLVNKAREFRQLAKTEANFSRVEQIINLC